jgi:transposase
MKYTFTSNEVAEVLAALKTEKNIIVKERLQAISMIMHNGKYDDIAKQMNRTRFFIHTWVKNYKESGLERLKERRGGIRHFYLTPEQEAFVKNIVIHSSPKDCDYNEVVWSGFILVDLIEKMFGKTYTRDGIYALLKRLGVSYKKANKIDPKKSQKVIKQWKEQIEKNSKN